MQVNDYNVCASTVQKIIDNDYQPAWKVVMNLGNCESYEDLRHRRRCLFFVLNNGPSEFLEDIMKHLNLLEIQILNKNIQNLMPSDNETLENEVDSEDEFADAVTTVSKKIFYFEFLMFGTLSIYSIECTFSHSRKLKSLFPIFWELLLN